MSIISVKYKCKEKDGWKTYQDEKVLDEVEIKRLLQFANIFVEEILEKYPGAVITEICIW